jgi:hypothetical protein
MNISLNIIMNLSLGMLTPASETLSMSTRLMRSMNFTLLLQLGVEGLDSHLGEVCFLSYHSSEMTFLVITLREHVGQVQVCRSKLITSNEDVSHHTAPLALTNPTRRDTNMIPLEDIG